MISQKQTLSNVAAEYLFTAQWKKTEFDEHEQQHFLSRVGEQVKSSEWEPRELDTTPGPDEVTPELLKWQKSDNRQRLLAQ